jgi:hypothetical protein
LYFPRLPLLHVSKLFCVRIPPDSGAVNTQFAHNLQTLDVRRIGGRARARDAPRMTGQAAALHHPESHRRRLHEDAARGWHRE